MSRIMFVALAVFALVAAGCAAPKTEPVAPVAPEETTSAPPPVVHEVVCRPVDLGGQPLVGAACRFRFPDVDEELAIDGDGAARMDIAQGMEGEVAASAPGHQGASVRLTVDGPKALRLVLEPEPAPARPPSEGPPPAADPTAPEPVQIKSRPWGSPATVVQSGSGSEPHIVIAPDGTIYYAPTNDLYRSTDGGASFQVVTPDSVESPPTLGSDTSTQVAPDGSVWWSRYWGYAGTTVGCTSTTRGDSWTCDNSAIPGVTDRMWIAGKSASEGFLQTNEGLYHHVWAQTITGSVKYTPYATGTTFLAVRNGNIAYDETRDAFWQIESVGDTQRLLRVDGATGLVPSKDTGIPNSYALPWLAVSNGTLWTTGEVSGAGGQRSVLAARSTDGGATWQEFPIRSEAKSVTFSYIAASGPRVALVYYGSDKAGDSTENGGTWSLFVSETDNALDTQPVWVETLVVPDIHTGNLCIGLSCESSGGDPEARFAGDLIGCAIGPDGAVQVAYVQDTGNDAAEGRYIRQRAA